MKKIALGLAAVALLATGVALARKKVEVPEAGGGGTQAPATSTLTAKQQLGCSLVLCMANPAGPWAAGQTCVDAMNERAKLLAKGKPIPSCPGVNTASTGGGGNTGGGGTRNENVKQQQN